jgi:hypothetical protein
MSVEMGLDIRGMSLNGAGTIHVDVLTKNNGNQAVNLSAGAYRFKLIDRDEHDVSGFKQTGEQPAIVIPVQPGQNHVWSFDFAAPSVQVGPTYTLVSCFPATDDESTQTFRFDAARTTQAN